MTSICRPIVLYNKQIPPTNRNLHCDFLIFGDYDGVTVKDNIFDGDYNDFSQLWYDLVDETKRLDGSYIYRTIYAFRFEEESKETITDEEFYAQKSQHFLFFSMLQFADSELNLPEVRRRIETYLNTKHRAEGLSAICYLTIDNASLLLILKSRSYDLAAQVINEFRYQCRNICGFSLNYSYTIFGYSSRELNEGTDYLADASIVDEVSLYVVESHPGSIIDYVEELKKNLMQVAPPKAESLELYNIFGNNDVIIKINQISWANLLSLYRDKGRGILSNESGCYMKCVYNITTHIGMRRSELQEELPFGIVEKTEGVSESVGYSTFDCIRKLILDKLEQNGSRYVEPELRKTYGKALLLILNSLQKYEKTNFSKYVFVSIFESLKMFIDLNDKYFNRIARDNLDLEFINAINILVQNTIGVDRSFAETPDFNAAIYHSPVKLNAFYTSYTYFITEHLKKVKGKTVEKGDYKFLICPWMEAQIMSYGVFEENVIDKNVILVKIPERFLYQPNLLMILLAHEINHYVGERIRNRKNRYSCFMEIILNSITVYLKKYKKLTGFIDEEDYKFITGFFRDKFKNSSDQYLRLKMKHQPNYDSIRYTLQAVQEEFNNVIRSFIIDNQNELFHILKRKYYEHNKGKLDDLYNKVMDHGCDMIDSRLLQEQQNKILQYEKAWNEAMMKLLINSEEELISTSIWMIRDLFSESYADLIEIMTLRLDPEDYIDSFFRINDKYNSRFLIRIILVVYTMCNPSDENAAGNIEWKEKWNTLSARYSVSKSTGYLANTIANVNIMIDNIHKRTMGGFVRQDVMKKEYLIFNEYETWKQLLQYLGDCKKSYLACHADDDKDTDYSRMLNCFRKLKAPNMEQSIIRMEEIIGKYIRYVYSQIIV